MVRDCIANVVERLNDRGFDPRKVGPDSWESRCPAHRSADRALSIMRNELNHLILECRSSENCEYIRIIRALGFANEHVYAEVQLVDQPAKACADSTRNFQELPCASES